MGKRERERHKLLVPKMMYTLFSYIYTSHPTVCDDKILLLLITITVNKHDKNTQANDAHQFSN